MKRENREITVVGQWTVSALYSFKKDNKGCIKRYNVEQDKVYRGSYTSVILYKLVLNESVESALASKMSKIKVKVIWQWV